MMKPNFLLLWNGKDVEKLQLEVIEKGLPISVETEWNWRPENGKLWWEICLNFPQNGTSKQFIEEKVQQGALKPL